MWIVTSFLEEFGLLVVDRLVARGESVLVLRTATVCGVGVFNE